MSVCVIDPNGPPAIPPGPDQEGPPPQFMTSWIPTPPPPYSTTASKLLHPIVIPRIDTTSVLSAKLPFVRAYSHVLRAHGINEGEFMSFMDMLAVCQAPPVPLQMLDAASHVVGIVPEPVAMGVSAGMGVAAGVGTAATTIVRTRRFMEKVNREFFAPRGLKAGICKSEELAGKLGCGPITVDSLPAESLASDGTQQHLRDRYMQALSPCIAPLTFDVPPPSKQRHFLDELSAQALKRRVKKRESRQKKKVEKANRKNSKQATDRANEGYDSDSSSSSSSTDSSAVRGDEDGVHADKKIRKIERETERKMSKANTKDAAKLAEKKEKKIEKREREIERRAEKDDEKAARKSAKAAVKSEKKGDKRKRKEEEKIAAMEFLVVENLDSPA
ncbi:uncharacterized protein CC84DRAFT_1162753 [Paraphaeosphaeria sporulosa]|uniref:Uncharacterized protein n=1 Tax=Paraphaeosphaeria sporulosa TaxID=1460663 RepID=A0A177CN59_9PLEO|nr:uncharacterized protein CC84DRAFT_1162753 [Paraphaeosphaeria sporulosa]OAG08934.1 hypothetical protein CC84DRAFT_1162753 [Paraphaeosphaeria sporulosa]